MQLSTNTNFLGERANVIKRDDNLHPEGTFQKRPDQTWAPGERAGIVKRSDNLHLEGSFSQRLDTTWAPGRVYLNKNDFFHFSCKYIYVATEH